MGKQTIKKLFTNENNTDIGINMCTMLMSYSGNIPESRIWRRGFNSPHQHQEGIMGISNREKLILRIENHLENLKAKPNNSNFNILVVFLIYDCLIMLMRDVELEKLENICLDIMDFLEDLEDLSEDDFNRMMGNDDD